MVIALIFDTLLLIALIAAIWRGGTIERLGAALCILATVLTVVSSPLRIRFQGVRLDLLTIDMATLLAFVALARASRRFWPIWAFGFAVANISTNVVGAWVPRVPLFAYLTGLGIYAYLALSVLLLGTFSLPRSANPWLRHGGRGAAFGGNPTHARSCD